VRNGSKAKEVTQMSNFSFDFSGTHIDCAAAPYGWQARLGA
jgi:hypothetical protein